MKDEPVEVKNIGKYRIKIFQDTDPTSPREDDNLGKMVCFNGRHGYKLGDEHNFNALDYDSWDEIESAIKKAEKVAVILPIFKYEHGGITIATTPFGCRWDSGQIGFTFVTKEALLKEYGGKYCTKKKIEKCKEILQGEVKTYDQYLTGDVYGYQLSEVVTCDKGHEHEEELDNCWGYYGQEYCIEEAESIVSYYLKEDETVPA